MPNVIQHKRNSTPGNIPSTGSLAQGELGINIGDGKVYTKNSSNNIINIAVSGINGENISPSGAVFSGNVTLNNQTSNTIAGFDSNKNITTLSTATYPSLTELSYVKGVTSGVQTQLNSKQATLTNPVTGTGTTNYVSKWTSSSAQGNSIVFDNGINVGVGDNNPSTKLAVSGVITATSGNSNNWNTAYDHSQLTSGSVHGSTTVGGNLLRLENPSAIRFLRVNNDNTVSTLTDSEFRTAIGAGTSSTNGTVTSVGGTGTIAGLTLTGTVTAAGNLTLGGTLSVAASNFSSQTANTFLAAPNASNGVPTFRTIVASDIPTLNQNTTGNADTVTNGVYIIGAQSISGVKTFKDRVISDSGPLILFGASRQNEGNIHLSNTTCNYISFNASGVGTPDGFNRSLGTKIILSPSPGSSSSDMGIGTESNALWFSVPNATYSTKWYSSSTNTATLTGSGVFTVAGATSQINVDNLRLDGNTLSATNTNGNILVSPNGVGNVGIGVTSPSARLTVKGSGATSASSSVIVSDSSDNTLFFVRNDGHVGINEITPEARLTVRSTGSTAATEILRLKNSNSSAQFVVDSLANCTTTGYSFRYSNWVTDYGQLGYLDFYNSNEDVEESVAYIMGGTATSSAEGYIELAAANILGATNSTINHRATHVTIGFDDLLETIDAGRSARMTIKGTSATSGSFGLIVRDVNHHNLFSVRNDGLVDVRDDIVARGYLEKTSAPTISSGALTLNLNNSRTFLVSLNASITTLTISNAPSANSTAVSFTIIFTADGTARTVAWPASVKWPAGTPPTLTSTNAKKDILSFVSTDQGSTWLGFIGGQNY